MKKISIILVAFILLSSCEGGGSGKKEQTYSKDEVEPSSYNPLYTVDPVTSQDEPVTSQDEPEQDEEAEEDDEYEIIDTPNPTYSYSFENDDEEMSEEERYFAKFSNFEPSSSDRKGVVVYEGQGDYYIIETTSGYVVAERYSGVLYEDHTIYGPLHSYGFKYFINLNRDSEVKLYIEDYMLSQDRAIEWMGEHHKLKYYDQSHYDEDNEY